MDRGAPVRASARSRSTRRESPAPDVTSLNPWPRQCRSRRRSSGQALTQFELALPRQRAAAVAERLRFPERSLMVSIPARDVDDVEVRAAEAAVRGAKGGVRCNPRDVKKYAAHVAALGEEEPSRLVAETAPAWRLFVEFLAQTGLRPSEALALRSGELDLGRRRVQMRRSVNRGRVGPPKTKHGRRDVPRTLRHTCASILLRRGYNPKQVQA
jgi:integrase